jgi:hypothetical protein
MNVLLTPAREFVENFMENASAAHLKFLHLERRILSRNFKWKSGTRIIDLLVPMTFRSS